MINPAAPGYFDDPYPHYALLRDTRSVYEDPRGPWMVFGYDDVQKVLHDPNISSRLSNAPDTDRTRRLVESWGDNIVTHPHMSRADPPEHTRLRKPVARPFAPRMIDPVRARIRTTIDELLEAAGTEDVDVISSLGRPLPYRIMCGLLGFPAGGDDSLLIECSHAFVTATMEPFLTVTEVDSVVEANARLTAEIRDAVEWKRSHLDDDLMSLLLDAHEQRDALSTDEVIEQIRLLFAAGHETTVNAVGNALVALLQHPDQWALLVADPELIPNAVEELLRFDNTIQIAWRTTPSDFDLGSVTIPAGCDVVGWVGSANRDRAKWGDTADDLDLTRSNARDHLSFGKGFHLCLGAFLARAELQELLRVLVDRFPRMELASEVTWKQLVAVRGPESLHVQLRA
jgi:cytochrome P450